MPCVSLPPRLQKSFQLVVVLLLWPVVVAQVLSEPSVHAFYLPSERHSATVTVVTSANQKVRCTFDVVVGTNDAAPPPPVVVAPPAPALSSSPQERVMKLHNEGACFETRDSNWAYQLCLGKEIVQWNTQMRQSLGSFSSFSQPDQLKELYQRGTPCENIPPGNVVRSTTVSFACSTGQGPRGLIVQEPTPCVYAMFAVDKEFCGLPEFPSLSAPAVSTAGAPPAEVHMPQLWLVEVAELLDGQVECSAHLATKHSNGPHIISFNLALDGRNVQSSVCQMHGRSACEGVATDAARISSASMTSGLEWVSVAG